QNLVRPRIVATELTTPVAKAPTDVRPLELSREISAVQFSKELFQIEMPALGTVVARENAAESHTVHAAARAAGARVFGIGRDERGGRFAAVDAGEQQRRRGLQHGKRRAAQKIGDRKSTRLNSSHGSISYAVFCLK